MESRKVAISFSFYLFLKLFKALWKYRKHFSIVILLASGDDAVRFRVIIRGWGSFYIPTSYFPGHFSSSFFFRHLLGIHKVYFTLPIYVQTFGLVSILFVRIMK